MQPQRPLAIAFQLQVAMVMVDGEKDFSEIWVEL
jgi:hypothetical protein